MTNLETFSESNKVSAVASEPKSLTIQDTKICAWTKMSVLLKIGFDGTGVEMVEKKVTLDHNATQLRLL